VTEGTVGVPAGPMVSFVVPCYNYGRYLFECLHSIFDQQGTYSFEIVLIDDGSTDNTHEVLRLFRDPRLRVIVHPKNQGHVAAINEGLSRTQGSFIARIDPDDRYRPYFLQATLEKFQAFPEVGLVYGDAAMIDEQGRITAERCDSIHGGQDFKGNELVMLLEKNFICSPTVIVRREAWQKALPVPEGLAFHDWFFTLMMAREYDFYYIDRVLADYRVHPLNHHSKVVRDKTEEPSIFWLLHRIFETSERTQEMEEQKQRFRKRIYAAQYLTLANKYFGFQMDSDARRCYLQAIRYRPQYLIGPATLRRLIGTFMGRRAYERSKYVLKGVLRLGPVK